ncbi:FHA domain-containing protein [Streptomyces avidinii]|uniref:FHA domain-containing protein n=1 Tax=Streptomyces avidinii TaxID=1895 RepID=UPI0038643685
MLVQHPDGSWSVMDQNSTNGTTINGGEEPRHRGTPGRARPPRPDPAPAPRRHNLPGWRGVGPFLARISVLRGTRSGTVPGREVVQVDVPVPADRGVAS